MVTTVQSLDFAPREGTPVLPLASRGSRLFAAVADCVIAILVGLPFFLLTVGSAVFGILFFVALVGLGYVQLSRMARTGQSLGKQMARIRVVKTDGAPAGFWHGVFLRYWAAPIAISLIDGVAFLAGDGVTGATASLVSMLASTVMFFDVLFIFGPARRTLHDRIAGTVVVMF